MTSTLIRRTFAAFACTASLVAHAQDFPVRAITLVVPYPPGSATDNIARPLAQALGSILGQTVVIDNKAGAQGMVGGDFVARAKPDGYTLLASSSATFVGDALMKSIPHDPVKAFQPVSGIGATSFMLLVRTDSPLQTIADLVNASKLSNTPMPVGYGSATGQLLLGVLSSTAGAQVTQVSYRGVPQVITDLIGGQVPAGVVDIGNGVAQIKGGRVRALVQTGRARSAAAPTVPTLAETYPGTTLESIISVVAPAGTPRAVVDRLDRALRAALDKPELKAAWGAITTEVLPMTTAEVTKQINTDVVKWKQLIKAAGIEPQ